MPSTRIAVLVMLASCASGFPKVDLTTLPKPTDFPDAKYVVLLDEDDVQFSAGEGGKAQALITERRRIKLLKPYSVPDVQAYYDTEFSTLLSMSARAVLPDGTEKPVDTSKAYDRPVTSSSELFSNTRLRSVSAPALPVGAVFETVIVTLQRDVEPWVLRHTFGEDAPVLRSRAVVTAPSTWALRWTTTTYAGPVPADPPAESRDGSTSKWVFELENLPAFDHESYAPPVWRRHKRLSLRLDRWSENGVSKEAPQSPEALSRWRWDRYSELAKPTPDIEATAQKVLQGVPDEPFAKARALYEYACRSIQYCAVEVGYGGWIPHAAKDVHAKKWGDCKDKATYLKALLTVAGIESSPTIIYSHDGWPMPFELPSLGANFNHAILAVHLPQGTVYADPTTRAVPFGQLPYNDADATVLTLSKEGSTLAKTPPSRAQDNRELQRFSLTVDPAGGATGHFVIEATGDSAGRKKARALMGTGKLEPWVQEQLWLHHTNVSKARFDEAGDFAVATKLSGELTVRGLLMSGLGTTALFRLSDVVNEHAPQISRDRTVPFAWAWLATLETELELKLPPGVTVSKVPADAEVTSKFGEYRLSWIRKDETLVVKRSFVEKQRVFGADELEALRDFSGKIRTAESQPAVFRFGGAK